MKVTNKLKFEYGMRSTQDALNVKLLILKPLATSYRKIYQRTQNFFYLQKKTNLAGTEKFKQKLISNIIFWSSTKDNIARFPRQKSQHD